MSQEHKQAKVEIIKVAMASLKALEGVKVGAEIAVLNLLASSVQWASADSMMMLMIIGSRATHDGSSGASNFFSSAQQKEKCRSCSAFPCEIVEKEKPSTPDMCQNGNTNAKLETDN